MDMDRAYANGAFIAGADAYPPRWAEKAAAFRAKLGKRARLGLDYGAGCAAQVRSVPARDTAIGLRDLHSRRLLAGVRARAMVASCGGGSGARLGLRDAVLHPGTRGPDHRDDRRNRTGDHRHLPAKWQARLS